MRTLVTVTVTSRVTVKMEVEHEPHEAPTDLTPEEQKRAMDLVDFRFGERIIEEVIEAAP